MQLDPPGGGTSLRRRLGAAACMLLASAAPGVARADGSTTQFDASALLYGEAGRANVVEPTARITRLSPDGQSLSAQLGIDVITGASPSGALPSGVSSGAVQTTTTPSGNTTTTSPPPPSQIPLSKFKDLRGALDLEWQKPIWLFTPTIGAHASREKDYQSLGGDAQLAVDLMNRLTTLTAGAGYNQDGVFPVGGVTPGLSDATVVPVKETESKRVTSALAGISRVLTRRWMVGINAARIYERGYLTEPYKVLSVVDPATGLPQSALTEKRPGSRDRRSVLANSVYHLTRDVLYLSYRYYWDDWEVKSNTVDARYRRELGGDNYLEPHVRLYEQTAARFFRAGLVQGAPLPEFATSDYRLGLLRTATVGATYGFHLPNSPGEWSVRAEYMGQFGERHPKDAVGVQRTYDLFPATNIGSLVAGYTVTF
jgi:hypothetical protein